MNIAGLLTILNRHIKVISIQIELFSLNNMFVLPAVLCTPWKQWMLINS